MPVFTQEASLKTSTSNGHKSNGPNSKDAIRFEIKRSSGWYDAIDSPSDPLPRGRTSRMEHEDDEWGENNLFYSIDVESIQDLKSIQVESGCALNVSFAPGDYDLPTIEILDGGAVSSGVSGAFVGDVDYEENDERA